MTPDQRFTVIITLLGAACTGLAALARAMFRVSRQWLLTGKELENLGEDIRGLVDTKEKDHARFERRIEHVEHRVERHEEWHQNRPDRA